jgi:hypothetical protein
MTAPKPILTLNDMMKFVRRRRDHYLDRLAAEPLFQGVPRALMPLVGRGVDPLHLASGTTTPCDPTRETIIITVGNALLTDADDHLIAILGPGGIIGHHPLDHQTERARIVAITALQALVIARRELQALTAIAPRIAEALTPRNTTVVERSEPAPPEPIRDLTQSTKRGPATTALQATRLAHE